MSSERNPQARPGSRHTTGAGSVDARRVVRSGDPAVPSVTTPTPDRPGTEAGGPALVGAAGTGEPDETPEPDGRPG